MEYLPRGGGAMARPAPARSPARFSLRRASGAARRVTRRDVDSISRVTATTLTPMLTVKDTRSAVEFYRRAFGAAELSRVSTPTGQLIVELTIDDQRFYVADENPAAFNLSPATLGGTSVGSTLSSAILTQWRRGRSPPARRRSFRSPISLMACGRAVSRIHQATTGPLGGPLADARPSLRCSVEHLSGESNRGTEGWSLPICPLPLLSTAPAGSGRVRACPAARARASTVHVMAAREAAMRREIARRGGRANIRRHGVERMRAIGSKGGKVFVRRWGTNPSMRALLGGPEYPDYPKDDV